MYEQIVKDPSDIKHLNSLPTWATFRHRVRYGKTETAGFCHRSTNEQICSYTKSYDMKVDNKKVDNIVVLVS